MVIYLRECRNAGLSHTRTRLLSKTNIQREYGQWRSMHSNSHYQMLSYGEYVSHGNNFDLRSRIICSISFSSFVCRTQKRLLDTALKHDTAIYDTITPQYRLC